MCCRRRQAGTSRDAPALRAAMPCAGVLASEQDDRNHRRQASLAKPDLAGPGVTGHDEPWPAARFMHGNRAFAQHHASGAVHAQRDLSRSSAVRRETADTARPPCLHRSIDSTTDAHPAAIPAGSVAVTHCGRRRRESTPPCALDRSAGRCARRASTGGCSRGRRCGSGPRSLDDTQRRKRSRPG